MSLKHVALEKIRETINLLRKSNISSELNTDGKSVLSVLKELQDRVRYSDAGPIDPKALLLPFLRMIRSQTISGPYVRKAIESIQSFLLGDILLGDPQHTCDALDEIVVAITRCRFVLTDVQGDEMVQLHMLETLRIIVNTANSEFLNDATQWHILHFCCLNLTKAGGGNGSMLVYQAAERTIHDTLSFLLRAFTASQRRSHTSAAETSNNSNGTLVHGAFQYSTGVPTLCKFLEYLLGVIREAADPSGGKGSDGTSSGSGGSSSSSQRQAAAGGHRRTLSQQQHVPYQPPLNEVSYDRSTLHLLFALKTISRLLTVAGNGPVIRDLLIRSKEFSRLLSDELGFNLLQLCAGSSSSGNVSAGGNGSQSPVPGVPSQHSPAVLSAVLGVFGSLVQTAGPCLRILVESFVRQVYLKALIQTYDLFIDQLHFLSEGMELTSPFIWIPSDHTAGTAGSAAPAPALEDTTFFRLDELELILESLGDVVSDLSFLPALFVSFDCDPTSADLVQPLLEYLSRCSCLVLTFASEFMTGYFKGTGMLVKHVFKQVIKTFMLRNEAREAATARLSNLSARTPSKDVDDVTPIVEQSRYERARAIASLMKASRGAKHIFFEASALFEDKPEKGLKYLQERGALPTPLTPESVAAFLRLAPDLPKPVTGAYLGELGKEDAKYVGNSKEFHTLVLLRYVESFEFSNQSVLDCMRIFLSAFRLPGEAQQIDRILVAFSEHCHSQCLEGKSGILENAEVTYILTFSIIMLNTDRHNPNVRADRKMTLEQFVRNNTNYGKDGNQTIPLPKDFLTAIFHSIEELPIRTQGKELAGSVTAEVWKDLQMQARVDPRRAMLVTPQPQEKFLQDMWEATSQSTTGDAQLLDQLLRDNSPVDGDSGSSTAFIVRKLLDSKQRTSSVVNPIHLSLEISGQYGLFDVDLLECNWLNLLRVCLSVHVHNAVVMQKVMALEFEGDVSDHAIERGPVVLKHAQLKKLMTTSNNLLVEFLKVANACKLNVALDTACVTLVWCTGMMKAKLANKLLAFLRWDAAALPLADSQSSRTLLSSSSTHVPRLSEGAIADSALLLYQLRHFESARCSASTLLSLILSSQAAIGNWSLVWYFLGGLRDCAVLPKEMVLDVDADLLPPNIREEFELALLDIDRKAFEQGKPVAPKKVKRQNTSLLSLQGLGEALFGGAETSEEVHSNSPFEGALSANEEYNADLADFKHAFKLDAVSARWDAGYEAVSNGPGSPRPVAGEEGISKSDSESRIAKHAANLHQKAIPAFSIVDGGMTVEELRSVIATSGIAQLVSDSRFLSEQSLDALLRSLVAMAEAKDESHQRDQSDAQPVSSSVPAEAGSEAPTSEEAKEGKTVQFSRNASDELLHVTRDFLAASHSALSAKHSFSSSTVSWLEMVLVEVSLRNRDRFSTFWPILKHHYIRVLSGPLVDLSYVTERRVLGLLKICTRMISRDHFSGAILELMGRIFARAGPAATASLLTPGKGRAGGLNSNTEDDEGYTLSRPHFPPMSNHLLLHLSNQISAAMWRVLTLNVELLPLLPLEQWQTLFTIIALCASTGSFAAIKSFESMAWLLHEPRLIAKVPVFCIIGVKPLLRNQSAPLSVSIGAVHLLTHLHGRLEVLIKDDGEDCLDCEDYDIDGHHNEGDTPILWESCWTPILRALGEGILDTRAPVREACAEALCQAILDRHSHAVPAGVLVDILGGIIAPMIVQLRDHLVDEINKNLPAGVAQVLSSKEALALAQQQWVNVEAETGPVPGADDAAVAPNNNSSSSNTVTEGDRVREGLSVLCATGSERGGGGTVSILMECLSAFCKSFLQHLRKLAAYPSFDKLWLCMLSVLSHFLDASTHGDEELAHISAAWTRLSEDTKHLVQDLFAMLAASREHLLRMLRALAAEKVFVDRPGLLGITKDSVKQFDGCSEILVELDSL